MLQSKGEIEDDDIVIIEDNCIRNPNRLRIIVDDKCDEDIPEEVAWKLFLARQLAVLSVKGS